MVGGEKAGADNLFREDLQFDVADDWNAAPCYGGCPEGGAVRNFAFDGWEVWMGRGEEVE